MGNQCGIDLCEKKAKSRVGTFPIDLGERKKQKVEWEHFLSQLPIWLKWAIKPHITLLLASRKGEINQGTNQFQCLLIFYSKHAEKIGLRSCAWYKFFFGQFWWFPCFTFVSFRSNLMDASASNNTRKQKRDFYETQKSEEFLQSFSPHQNQMNYANTMNCQSKIQQQNISKCLKVHNH